MIIAERKPFEEIEAMLEGYKKVLLVGCDTCVTVCMAGGEKEVGVLASMLRLSAQKNGRELGVVETTIERQCDREFVDPLKDEVEACDVVMSMACGVGVNYVAEIFDDKRVLPAVNTKFYGANIAEGIWAERCAGCGDCVLGTTEAICPVARCSKSLLNGPCGGSQNGKCEVDPETDCAWELIYKRMERLGMLDKLEEVIPPKDWSTGRDGGPGKVMRPDVASVEEQVT
jgi:ferredoxin